MHIAELNIRGETGSVSVEVEKGAALLPLGGQHRPIKYIDDAGYPLKRLVEMGPVIASADTDIEPGPVPNSRRRWRRSFDGHIGGKDHNACCDDLTTPANNGNKSAIHLTTCDGWLLNQFLLPFATRAIRNLSKKRRSPDFRPVLPRSNVRCGSKPEKLNASTCFPLCPRTRTHVGHRAMSEKC